MSAFRLKRQNPLRFSLLTRTIKKPRPDNYRDGVLKNQNRILIYSKSISSSASLRSEYLKSGNTFLSGIRKNHIPEYSFR